MAPVYPTHPLCLQVYISPPSSRFVKLTYLAYTDSGNRPTTVLTRLDDDGQHYVAAAAEAAEAAVVVEYSYYQ